MLLRSVLPRVPTVMSRSGTARAFSAAANSRVKVVAFLYPGGEAGAKNKNILGCVENALGLPEWIKTSTNGSRVNLVVTSDSAVLEKNLHDAHIVISQPFYPAYLTRSRIAMAPKLQMSLTAGVGSDHVDLEAAAERKLSVVEITGSNVVSVAEHVVMQILALVRNFIPGYKQVVEGKWDIAAVADRAYDLEDKAVGTIGAGRIGVRVLERLRPFSVKLHYYDKFRLAPELESRLNVQYHSTIESLVKACDIVTINCPLHPETENLINEELLRSFKDGAYIVNTARAKICDRDAITAALKSGKLRGYAGDVWFPQPAPADHPWRQMPHHAMTVHYSGTTLDAQARYAAGVREVLDNYLSGSQIQKPYLILDNGRLATTAYTGGNATKGALPSAK